MLLVLALIAGVASAEEALHSGEHGEGHHYHENVVAGFIGVTSEERREGALTLGFEYGRRFSERFGVLFSVERALGDLDFTVVAIPFTFTQGPWTFSLGPGIEFPDQEGDNEFLARAGVSYAFDLGGGREAAPKLMVDFVDGEAVLIGGVAIGFGF